MRTIIMIVFAFQLIFSSCFNPESTIDPFSHPSFSPLNQLVDASDFTADVDGKNTALFTLTNSNGLVVKITNYGARLVSILSPNKDGVYEDVVLGYSNINEYLADYTKQGATVGRFANRIAYAQFTIDGETYKLTKNAGAHILHGGDVAFDAVVWDADFQDTALVLTLSLIHISEPTRPY